MYWNFTSLADMCTCLHLWTWKHQMLPWQPLVSFLRCHPTWMLLFLSAWPGMCQFVWLAGQLCLGNLPVSTSPVLGLQMCHHAEHFFFKLVCKVADFLMSFSYILSFDCPSLLSRLLLPSPDSSSLFKYFLSYSSCNLMSQGFYCPQHSPWKRLSSPFMNPCLLSGVLYTPAPTKIQMQRK